jgi:NodT family efflux transporter outer membrane factor (OMF) lipoprotein
MQLRLPALPSQPLILPIVLLGLTLQGCAAPYLGPQREPLSASDAASVASLPGDAEWPTDRWWQALGDDQLVSLIDIALVRSPDVAMATARLRAADALVQQAGGALVPTLSTDGTAGGNQQSQNLGIPPQFVPDGIVSSGRLTVMASFNLDLWGRNRAALRAARGEAAAARVDGAQAQLMLITGIATAYADFARITSERREVETALDLVDQSVSLIGRRVAQGLDNRTPLAEAEARRASILADSEALAESEALARHRLAALVGQGPDYGLTLTAPTLSVASTAVPADAGIGLVGRRPDLVATRLRVEAAAQRIQIARADFYPNISLNALIGLQSLGLGNLLQSDSLYGNAGPAISLPVFDGGRIEGRYRGSRADYDAAVARYDATLLDALRETADAFSSLQRTRERIAAQQAAVAALADAERIARLRFTNGLANRLPLLQAQQASVTARRGLLALEARRQQLSIALTRALGGGFVASSDSTPPTGPS